MVSCLPRWMKSLWRKRNPWETKKGEEGRRGGEDEGRKEGEERLGEERVEGGKSRRGELHAIKDAAS